MPLRFSHLIFDVDGTLLDPQIGMLTQFAVMFREFGYAVEDKESLRWSIGPPIRPTIKQLLNNANDETVELALARYRELFEEFGIHQVRLYPNVHEVLTSLSEAGYHLYIATSRSDYLTDAILELTDLKRHFRGVHAPTPEGEREDKASLLKHLL
ncbi:MAG: HAD hydrolase-like protein, partial [Candidatus Kapaibacterium sp.]